MSKLIIIFREDSSTPISDSITVTATQTVSPFLVHTGALIPAEGGLNNGARLFTNVAPGDYTIKFNGTTQTDLSPLFMPGAPDPVYVPGAGEIDTVNLADDAVTTIKIEDLAVTTAKIADFAITVQKIGTGAIGGINISNGAITKAHLFGSGIFNNKMIDSSGWGPKLDGVTISSNTNSEIYVPDGAITSAKIADLSITTAKIQDGSIINSKIADLAITTAKIAAGAITQSELGLGSISTTNIQNLAITAEKISTSSIQGTHIADLAITTAKIAAGAVTETQIGTNVINLEKLSESLRNSMLRFPSKTVYVSPEFTDNVSPYFDNVEDAYIEALSSLGTIILYPGTYLSSLLIEDSVNIIGQDKLRCIIQWTPTSLINYGIKITGLTKNLLLSNFTLKIPSASSLSSDVVGLWLVGASSHFVTGEDLIISVRGPQHASDPGDSIGVILNNSEYLLKNSKIEVVSGYTGSDYSDSYGIIIESTALGSINSSTISVKNQGGLSTSKKARGIYYKDSNPDSNFEFCIIDSIDESFDGAELISPKVFNTLYSTPMGTSVLSTNLVQSVQNSLISLITTE